MHNKIMCNLLNKLGTLKEYKFWQKTMGRGLCGDDSGDKWDCSLKKKKEKKERSKFDQNLKVSACLNWSVCEKPRVVWG